MQSDRGVDSHHEAGQRHPGDQVSAGAVALQTENAELSSTATNQSEQQLPLAFRDPSELVNLVAGVSSDMRRGAGAGNYGYGNGMSYQSRLGFSMNGGMIEQVIAMLDGVDVTIDASDFNAVPVIPLPDFTQEFKTITNNYSAQFGRGSSVSNIITKRGTNALHGSAY